MLYAVIDIGSNTIRLSIYAFDGSTNEFKQIVNKKTMVGLAAYLEEDKTLSARGIARAIACLQSYAQKIGNFDVAETFAFATAVIRKAHNREEVVTRLEEASGFSIDVLTNEEEAAFGFMGARNSLKTDNGVLIDMGGASTEVTLFEEMHIKQSASLPFGSLTLFLDYVNALLPSKAEQDEISQYVLSNLQAYNFPIDCQPSLLFGIGGAARAVGKLNDTINNVNDDSEFIRCVSPSQTDSMLDYFSREGRQQIQSLLSVAPDRIHVAVPGMCAIAAIMRYFNSQELHICKQGVREGVLQSRVLGVDIESIRY